MRKMASQSDALSRFVSRMFETPALRELPVLQREEQAVSFVRQNSIQLQPLLSSMGITAAAGWPETVESLGQEIRALADRLLEGEISRAVVQRLRFAFVPALGASRQHPEKAQEEVVALCRKCANHPVSRRALSGSLSAVLSDLTEKYIPQIWERRKYTYVEVTRVQRMNLKADECADLLRFTLLVRPAAYLHVAQSGELGADAGFAPVQEQALQRVLPGLHAQLSSTSQELVRLALRGALPYPATQRLEAVPRLTAVLALRGRSLTPSLIVDRGADTPDKSWFNVARRNAAWRGLDLRMLDELYSIASENRW